MNENGIIELRRRSGRISTRLEPIKQKIEVEMDIYEFFRYVWCVSFLVYFFCSCRWLLMVALEITEDCRNRHWSNVRHRVYNWTVVPAVNGSECPICYENLEDPANGPVVKNATCVTCLFHKKCLRVWADARIVPLCPVCRRELEYKMPWVVGRWIKSALQYIRLRM